MVKDISMSCLKFLCMSFFLLSSIPSTELCNPTDYKVLHEIQEAMGSTPDLVSSFNLANDYCHGQAISCDSNGRVTSFIASKGNTSTKIPSSVGQLEYLQSFQFSYSPIYGSLPSSLTNLKYLIAIRVTGTNLNSTIPSFLGKITGLQNIDLGSNSLHGPIPRSLGKLISLERLDLSHNHLSGQIPESLGFCKALQILDFSNNQLTGNVPRSLGHVNIPNVALGSNQLTGDASHLFQNNTSNLFLYSNRFEFNFSNVFVEDTLNYFDMSNNLVYGGLPPSIDNPVFENFNVSRNRLCGPIPQSGTLQQFQADAFANNLCLCGRPLPPCSPS
ncbi:Polygalacturonase inhibitor-like protein [Drosera capensis]